VCLVPGTKKHDKAGSNTCACDVHDRLLYVLGITVKLQRAEYSAESNSRAADIRIMDESSDNLKRSFGGI
jgi:hypothetical protein